MLPLNNHSITTKAHNTIVEITVAVPRPYASFHRCSNLPVCWSFEVVFNFVVVFVVVFVVDSLLAASYSVLTERRR